MEPKVKLAPSILSADFARLGEQVREAVSAGADWIHVDVMDGHFVPNLTMGPLVVEALRPVTPLPLDVHLMVANPDALIPAFAEAGADHLTVHVETCPHLHRTVQLIHSFGKKAGVALNPATPVGVLEEILPFVEIVLVMSVNPGFGGQQYIPTSTRKVERVRALLDAHGREDVELVVDGGISPANAGEVVAAGATVLVAGSAIFNTRATVAQNMAALQAAVARAKRR